MSAYDWVGLAPEAARERVVRRDPHDFPFLFCLERHAQRSLCAFASPDELLDFIEDIVVEDWTAEADKKADARRRIGEARERIGSLDLSDALFAAVSEAVSSPHFRPLASWGAVDRYAADPAPKFAAVRDAFRCAQGLDTGERFEPIPKKCAEAFLAYLRRVR